MDDLTPLVVNSTQTGPRTVSTVKERRKREKEDLMLLSRELSRAFHTKSHALF